MYRAKNTLFTTSLLLLMAMAPGFASEAPPAAWKAYIAPLPSDARDALERERKCVSFGDSELAPADEKEYNILHCDESEQALDELAKKYPGDTKINDAINCVEASPMAPHDCPLSY